MPIEKTNLLKNCELKAKVVLAGLFKCLGRLVHLSEGQMHGII